MVEGPLPQSHHLHSIRFPDQASLTGTEGRAGPDLNPLPGKVALPCRAFLSLLRKCSSPIFGPCEAMPTTTSSCPRGSLGELHHVVLPFPSQLWAEVERVGDIRTPFPGAAPRAVGKVGGTGCSEPQRHRPGVKWLPWGTRALSGRSVRNRVSSPHAQVSFKKQIWLKAAQSGRLFQKALEASAWLRFWEVSSADQQPGFCTPGSRLQAQGLGVGAAGGGLGEQGKEGHHQGGSFQLSKGDLTAEVSRERGVPCRGMNSPSLETLKRAPSALGRPWSRRLD